MKIHPMSSYRLIIVALMFAYSGVLIAQNLQYYKSLAMHYYETHNIEKADENCVKALELAPSDNELILLKKNILSKMTEIKLNAKRKKDESIHRAAAVQKQQEIQDAESRKKEQALRPAREAKKAQRRICSCKLLLEWFNEGKLREEKISARSGIINKTAMYNVTNNILIVEEYLQKNFQDKGIDTGISCPGKKTDDDISNCLVPANNFRAGFRENGDPLE